MKNTIDRPKSAKEPASAKNEGGTPEKRDKPPQAAEIALSGEMSATPSPPYRAVVYQTSAITVEQIAQRAGVPAFDITCNQTGEITTVTLAASRPMARLALRYGADAWHALRAMEKALASVTENQSGDESPAQASLPID